MEIFYKLNKNPNLSLCLGFFDGIHQGHQVVIKNAVNFAKTNRLKSALITFSEHPLCEIMGYEIDYITPLEEKIELIRALGVDYLYVLEFTKEFEQKSAYEYLKDIIIENFAPKAITTGFNHYFGQKKEGDCDFLEKHKAEFGYKYFEIPPITFGSTIISSTVIKDLLANGEIKDANNLLGYRFYFKALVEKGEKIASTLDFPTANLEYPENMVKLPYGAYAVLAEADGKKYNAVANWGIKPTFGINKPVFEVHILDFNQNIYGKPVKVEVIDFIRDEMKFTSSKELKKQIEIDIECAKKILTEQRY